jgi:hypothetical protein
MSLDLIRLRMMCLSGGVPKFASPDPVNSYVRNVPLITVVMRTACSGWNRHFLLPRVFAYLLHTIWICVLGGRTKIPRLPVQAKLVRGRVLAYARGRDRASCGTL